MKEKEIIHKLTNENIFGKCVSVCVLAPPGKANHGCAIGGNQKTIN